MNIIFTFAIVLMLSACGSNLSLMPGVKLNSAPTDKPKVFALNKLEAQSGDIIEVAGLNLSSNMTVIIGGVELPIKVTGSSSATFVMPETDDVNSIGATFITKDRHTLATLALINSSGTARIPVMDVDPGLVCSDTIYKDPSGNLRSGARNCSSGVPLCQTEGQFPCVTSQAFSPVYTPSIQGQADKIRTGVKIAGVNGTLNDCATDGDAGCVAVGPTFAAVLKTGAASKIISGQSVGGVGGNVTLPAPGKVYSGITYGVSGTGLSGTLSLPLSTNVITGSGLYGDPGTLLTPSYSPDFPDVANVRTNDTVAGATGTLGDCSLDNESNCVTSATNPAVIASTVTAGKVKAGVTIAGVLGNYPSSTSPLASNTAVTDLTLYSSQISTTGSFEFFDSAGTRYTGSGDSNLIAANVKSGITLLGVTGSFGAPCATDASVGCITTTQYKAADTSAFNEYDIRYGKTVAGVAGALKQFGSAAALTLFNNTTSVSASSSTTVADSYDSIDDWNNYGPLPVLELPGRTPITITHWLRDAASDDGSGGGTANNGFCDGTEACIFRDRITGFDWTSDNATYYTWLNAIAFCENSTIGGHSDWKLPTAKDLLQVHIDNVYGMFSKMNLTDDYYYWSATTDAGATQRARKIYLDTGNIETDDKTASHRVVCFR